MSLLEYYYSGQFFWIQTLSGEIWKFKWLIDWIDSLWLCLSLQKLGGGAYKLTPSSMVPTLMLWTSFLNCLINNTSNEFVEWIAPLTYCGILTYPEVRHIVYKSGRLLPTNCKYNINKMIKTYRYLFSSYRLSFV